MAEYIISCESAVDIPPELAAENGIRMISFHYALDEDEYVDDYYRSISQHDFFRRILDGAISRTSALNTEDYLEYFEPILKEGKDILHITLSSGLSSTYQNCCLAQEILCEKYPNRSIRVLDSLGASSGYGLLVLKTAEIKRSEDLSITELFDRAKELRMHVNHLFFSTDLTFYIRGGRISKTAGVFAQALSICPLCDMDDMGFLIVREKVRTKAKVKKRIVEKMLELCEHGGHYDDLCLMSHADFEEDAKDIVAAIEEKIPALKGRILLNPIGPTIGAHTGPGTIALFFIGAERQVSEKSLKERANR
ncbi:MAG: DegV family protein [Lachnospiraceae bacterium]|nr:DegV family protein [Lachnospiraceae bacterium]